MAAKRPEGVGPTGLGVLAAKEEVSTLRAATPSVAFGDISPSRGRLPVHCYQNFIFPRCG